MERFGSGPQWILESMYWNPTGVQLSGESIDGLRKILTTADAELQDILVRKHARAVQLLKEGMKNGTAKLVPHETPVPSSTADTRFIMETGTVEGAYLLEIKRSEHPEVFEDAEVMGQAYESRLDTLHDTILWYIDSCAQKAASNQDLPPKK